MISCGYCERVNEQVIDDDYSRDGADQIFFVGYRGVMALYLLWLSVKISALSLLRTGLMIHLT